MIVLKKLLDLINKFSKFVYYKVKIVIVFEIINKKVIKFLGLKLIKEVKNC